ncbi:hypothetical protein D3C78_1340190 [compost metagenome]
MSSIDSTASTSVALRTADSRIPSLERRAKGRWINRPGINNRGKASSTTYTSGPPIIHRIKVNSRKKGKSASALSVVEVIRSRTDSSSLICEIKEPVDLERALFLMRKAWPKTRSEIRRSARFPIISEIFTRTMRMENSNRMASITPPKSTHKVGTDCAGTTRS